MVFNCIRRGLEVYGHFHEKLYTAVLSWNLRGYTHLVLYRVYWCMGVSTEKCDIKIQNTS